MSKRGFEPCLSSIRHLGLPPSRNSSVTFFQLWLSFEKTLQS